MAEGVTGLILAGGLSARMGRDKARLPWGKATLLDHVIETLRPLVDELLVAVDDAGRFRGLNVRVVEDLVPGAHALGGLYTGLLAASHEQCFACACDAPFLSAGLIRLLLERADGPRGPADRCDLVIPQTPEGLQPLHAVYAKSALPVIERQLRRREWDLKALVPKVRARIVGFDEVLQADPQGLSCLNLNTPEEYAAACALRERMMPVIDPRRGNR